MGRAVRSTLDLGEADLAGLRLYSGTGEELGVVVGVEIGRWGEPKKLVFTEDGGATRRVVPLRFVRRVEEHGVTLAGPREGYHITRLSRDQ